MRKEKYPPEPHFVYDGRIEVACPRVFLLTTTNVLSNVTCSGKKAFGAGALGLYLEGDTR